MDLQMRELSMDRVQELEEYRAEIIASGNTDGSGGICRGDCAADWVREQLQNRSVIHEGYRMTKEVYLLIDTDRDKVVGIGNFRYDLHPDYLQGVGHIGYSIRPSERGKGFGKLILKYLLQIAERRCQKDLILTCAVGNERSRRTILACGGEYLGNVINVFTEREVERYRIKL
ncbi:MAG: GNAT family N-acetyltransferase [Peptostreptococcaceae bacterium]|nr:GNAT family N-acetyltransferase [Peptostreptococcaceae bacterium]